MTIPNQPTVFRKKEVLKAGKLNQALGEYGSKGGIIPYDENGQGDTSHELPLGTKQNPFGNAFFKGMNIYTQLEVQQLVAAGKLTQTDRFVFWNLDTNTLCAWNGTEIVTLTGESENMKHLYGDGSDGNITYVADAALTKSWYRYKNMTLNAGITLSSALHVPIVMSVKETLTLNGTINFNNAGGTTTNGFPDSFGATLEGIKGTSSYTSNVTVGDSYYGLGHFDQSNGKGSVLRNFHRWVQVPGNSSTSYVNVSTLAACACGADGADANAMLRHLLSGKLFHTPVAGQGPSGGGGLIIYANNVVIDNSFVYSATGTSAGGCLAIAYKSGSVGTFSVSVGNGFYVIGKML